MTLRAEPQTRIIDRMQAVDQKLEKYREGDSEIHERVRAVVQTIEGWFESIDTMDEKDIEEAHKTLIISGIFETQEQRALHLQFYEYYQDEEYLDPLNPLTVKTLQSMYETSGASLKDLVTIIIICYKSADDTLGECLTRVLKRYKSAELDRIITENLGENFFEESLTDRSGNGMAAAAMLEVLDNKQQLMKTFGALTQKGKTIKDGLDPEEKDAADSFMFACGLRTIAGNLTEHHLKNLTKQEIGMLLTGIREFSEDYNPGVSDTTRKLEEQHRLKEMLESLN